MISLLLLLFAGSVEASEPIDAPEATVIGFSDFAYPVRSPDGGRLAFFSDIDGDAEIYVLHLEEGRLDKITDNDRWDATPDWTPDGLSLVYQSEIDGNREIFHVDLSNGVHRNLTSHPAEDSHPKVSADGESIIFDSSRATAEARGVDVPGANYEIYRMSIQGEAVKRLTYREGWDTYGDLSDDGRRLVWRGVLGEEENSEIFMLDLETGAQTQLTQHAAFDGYPDFLPDGRIVFCSDRAGGEYDFDIYLLDPDDKDLHRLTFTSEDSAFMRVTRPRGDRDGEHVTASRSFEGGTHLLSVTLPPRSGPAGAQETGRSPSPSQLRKER